VNRGGIGKVLDIRAYLLRAEVASQKPSVLAQAGLRGDLVALDVDCRDPPDPARWKSSGSASVIVGDSLTILRIAASAPKLFGEDAESSSRYSHSAQRRSMRDAEPSSRRQCVLDLSAP
jgi:hypothetical protein